MENDFRVILGLDISTTCIGCSIVVIDDDGSIKPVEVTHLKLSIPSSVKDNKGVKHKIEGAESLFLKTQLFSQKMIEYSKKYVIDKVIIEEPLANTTVNVNTTAALLKFNGMCSLIVFNTLGVIPDYISSYTARMYGMPQLMAIRKFNKKGEIYPKNKILKAIKNNECVLFGAYPFDVAKKDVIWGYVSDIFPNIKWIENNKGELKKENFDASDSLICILGYLNYIKYKEDKPKIESYELTDNGIGYIVSFCGNIYKKYIEF